MIHEWSYGRTCGDPPPFHKTLHQPMVEHYQCKSYAKFDFQLSSDVTTADN